MGFLQLRQTSLRLIRVRRVGIFFYDLPIKFCSVRLLRKPRPQTDRGLWEDNGHMTTAQTAPVFYIVGPGLALAINQ